MSDIPVDPSRLPLRERAFYAVDLQKEAELRRQKQEADRQRIARIDRGDWVMRTIKGILGGPDAPSMIFVGSAAGAADYWAGLMDGVPLVGWATGTGNVGQGVLVEDEGTRVIAFASLADLGEVLSTHRIAGGFVSNEELAAKVAQTL